MGLVGLLFSQSILVLGPIVQKPHLWALPSFRVWLPHLPAEQIQPSPRVQASLNEALKDTRNCLLFRKNFCPSTTPTSNPLLTRTCFQKTQPPQAT